MSVKQAAMIILSEIISEEHTPERVSGRRTLANFLSPVCAHETLIRQGGRCHICQRTFTRPIGVVR